MSIPNSKGNALSGGVKYTGGWGKICDFRLSVTSDPDFKVTTFVEVECLQKGASYYGQSYHTPLRNGTMFGDLHVTSKTRRAGLSASVRASCYCMCTQFVFFICLFFYILSVSSLSMYVFFCILFIICIT